MSTMIWTYQESQRGIALKDVGDYKKGDVIPIDVFDYTVSTRGGSPATIQQYYLGDSSPKNGSPQYQRPKSLMFTLGKDFEVLEDSDQSLQEPKSNLLVVGVLLAIGYLVYKQFKK